MKRVIGLTTTGSAMGMVLVALLATAPPANAMGLGGPDCGPPGHFTPVPLETGLTPELPEGSSPIRGSAELDQPRCGTVPTPFPIPAEGTLRHLVREVARNGGERGG